MTLAIHQKPGSFTERWIEYCQKQNIDYKTVNCYSNEFIHHINDCSALMWHFHHANARDVKFAKQLLYSVQISGKRVFPDFNTMWHFDDKVGQKYLLESIGAPLVPTHVFYSRQDALSWADKTSYPKVFKLRGGGGSTNVTLVKSKSQAMRLIKRAYGRGFSQYDAWGSLKERWRTFRNGKSDWINLTKGLLRFAQPTEFAKMAGNEKGYVYFQDFIEGNDHDIRVVIIGDKAFAIKRMTRDNDFRASGSGHILYEKEHFDPDLIKLAFRLNDKLKSQCIAYDFIFQDGQPLVVEISYGFSPVGYDPCPGYWDRDLNWYEGEFNPYGWMVDNLIISCQD